MPASPATPARLVLDTNVWLDLLVFADLRCAALRADIESGRARVLLRQDCHTEWQRVLAYPALQLDSARQTALTEAQRAFCEWIEADREARTGRLPRCRDPDDQKFLELAASGSADALLSRDQALLALDKRCRRAGLFAVTEPAAWRPCATEVG